MSKDKSNQNGKKDDVLYVNTFPTSLMKSISVNYTPDWLKHAPKDGGCGSCGDPVPIPVKYVRDNLGDCPVKITPKMVNALYYAAIYHPTDPNYYEKLMGKMNKDELLTIEEYLEYLKKDLKEKEEMIKEKGDMVYTFNEDGKKYVKIIGTKYSYPTTPLLTMGSDEIKSIQERLKHFRETGKFSSNNNTCPSCNQDNIIDIMPLGTNNNSGDSSSVVKYLLFGLIVTGLAYAVYRYKK